MKIVIEDGRQNFYQWDKDQRVKLEGVTLNHYVHFGRPDGGAYEVKIYKDGSWFYANVPNIWLQLSGIQKLYIVNGDKQTEHRASLFITPREKPDGYLYTESEILSFVSLDERLRRLEGDPSVGGYATEQYVQDYAQPKGDYLESSALPEAIYTALAQAKESGAFDGAPGEPGKNGQDYVLTPEDLTEIANQAAELVQIPEGDGKAFIVTITESGGKYTADKTPSEIYAAHNSGVPVLANLVLEGGILTAYLTVVQYDSAVFQVPNFMLGEEHMGATVFIAGNEPGDRSVSIVETTIPDSGGNVAYVGVEPAEDDIPKFFYGGALPQTKTDTIMPFRYISKTRDISGYCVTKAQGTSSMNYAKKNQTTKFYKDVDCTEKMKVDFKGWGEQNKFCFKANWIDISHARNVVSARLWGDIVKSRANYAELPELLRTSPNQGAIDGFPVKVYANGVYQGRYTLNIPKDAWMANMDDELDSHCILCGENYTSGCFREVSTGGWSDEVHDSMPTAISNRWKEVITFVMNSTDEEFRANLGLYFDIPSLIDYHLFGLAICGLDAYGKNQLYMTYDGQKWFASAYDMDSTWGLYWNGSKFVSTDYARTSYEDFVDDRQGNLLYIRLEQLFWSELRTRWAELKNGALSIDNIINRFERFTDIAPAELVAEDYASTTGDGKFTGIPSKTTNNIQQIRAFALARQAWTDEYLSSLVYIPCTGITLSVSELTFTAEGSQTLTATVTPDGCTDAATWESNNTSVATVNDGVVTAIANGNATITARCGNYSASCSVAVYGIAEAVPCTGISLDKTELTFDGEGTQTITATVTPSETTDNVVWVSSNPAVAAIAVEGNVCTVQSVSNGNAVITVTCGEQSASCSVSISGILDPSVVYSLPEATTFDGKSDYIDTGVKLFDTDKDFSIYLDFVGIGATGNTVHGILEDGSKWPGLSIGAGSNFSVDSGNTHFGMGTYNERHRVCITYAVGSSVANVHAFHENGANIGTLSMTKSTFDNTLLLGCGRNTNNVPAKYWNGTIYACEIYDRVLTESEIINKICLETGVITSVVWSDTPDYKINGGTQTSGANYVTDMIELPDGACSVTVSNVGTGAYTWLGIGQYDESGSHKGYKESGNHTNPHTVPIASGVTSIRVSAYPNTSACNDPANQLSVTFDRVVW